MNCFELTINSPEYIGDGLYFTEVAVYFSRSHVMVRMSPQLVTHCVWAIRHETLIKFVIIVIIIIIIIIIMQFYFAHFGERAVGDAILTGNYFKKLFGFAVLLVQATILHCLRTSVQN